MKVLLRPATEADYPLIYATWLKATYYGNNWFKQIKEEIFFNNYKKIIAHRLANNVVTVCCSEKDPDVVFGYSVSGPGVLHWVYVKKAWRRAGIAKNLIPQDCKEITSITKMGKLCNKGRLDFNPFKG